MLTRKHRKRKRDDVRTTDKKNKEQKFAQNPKVPGTKDRKGDSKHTSTVGMGNTSNKYSDKVYVQRETDEFVFFWQKESVFSQWYPSLFVVEDLTFNCAEQYMMYNKTVLSPDKELTKQVMTELDPSVQKKIGREAGKLPRFNRYEWEERCRDIVRKGNIAKFSQNPNLKRQLLKTHPKILAEASPFDEKWGIGLPANHPDVCKQKKWRGRNLLGEVLMEVREELKKDEEKAKKS